MVAMVSLSTKADDKCVGPFGNFLNCLMAEINRRIEGYQQEASSQVQSSISQCFSKLVLKFMCLLNYDSIRNYFRASCQTPSFSNANIDYFLPEPWAGRVKKILELVENLDPRVQKCMIENLKDVLAKKISDCIQQYGSADVKDFQLPKLPEMKNLDISKL